MLVSLYLTIRPNAHDSRSHGPDTGSGDGSHVVDPSAHGIAPHQPSIEGLQQFRHLNHILHSRIEPQIVAVRIKDDRHSVVDSSGHGIWRRGQNRAGLDPFSACVSPAIP
jgi:hypothetical protein